MRVVSRREEANKMPKRQRGATGSTNKTPGGTGAPLSYRVVREVEASESAGLRNWQRILPTAVGSIVRNAVVGHCWIGSLRAKDSIAIGYRSGPRGRKLLHKHTS